MSDINPMKFHEMHFFTRLKERFGISFKDFPRKEIEDQIFNNELPIFDKEKFGTRMNFVVEIKGHRVVIVYDILERFFVTALKDSFLSRKYRYIKHKTENRLTKMTPYLKKEERKNNKLTDYLKHSA